MVDVAPAQIGREDLVVAELALVPAADLAHGFENAGLEVDQRSDHVEGEHLEIME